MSRIVAFLKVGEEKWLRKLQDEGEVYFSSIQAMRQPDTEDHRFDPYEGVSAIKNTGKATAYFEALKHTGNIENLHLVESYETVLGNIFCLFSISSNWWKNPAQFSIADQLSEFGSHCLVIDPGTLIGGIERAFKDSLISLDHDYVRYYDEKQHNGKVDLFMKRQRYSYQKEFRFYIRRRSIKPYKVKIGSLHGHSILIRSSQLHEIGLSPKRALAD